VAIHLRLSVKKRSAALDLSAALRKKLSKIKLYLQVAFSYDHIDQSGTLVQIIND